MIFIIALYLLDMISLPLQSDGQEIPTDLGFEIYRRLVEFNLDQSMDER